MARSHKAHKVTHHGSRSRKVALKPQFVRTAMRQSRGPQHTTVEGFIASVEQDVEAERESQDLPDFE